MADKIVVVPQHSLKPIKIVKWKVNEGNSISIGCVLLLYKVDGDNTIESCKLKSTKAGTVHRIVAQEEDVVKFGDTLLELKACIHPTVMKDMCAECGADLRKDDLETTASVPMIHSVPELKVSVELAQKLGKADSDRLLKDRKLVLLVDLDQTLIHTTNDNIPANIKDVYHFQLYGPTSPWYHTRLRPGTHQFLTKISSLYELHICTFGARNYAHMIAMFLDQDGQLFSHRILSRDECFSSNSKTANLKALFPCGDNMVCIIDDREDVWSYASNLIHVKPYHFFQHTGDINAPPGLDKHEDDDKEGVDLTKVHNKSKTVKINGSSDLVEQTDENNIETTLTTDEQAENLTDEQKATNLERKELRLPKRKGHNKKKIISQNSKRRLKQRVDVKTNNIDINEEITEISKSEENKIKKQEICSKISENDLQKCTNEQQSREKTERNKEIVPLLGDVKKDTIQNIKQKRTVEKETNKNDIQKSSGTNEENIEKIVNSTTCKKKEIKGSTSKEPINNKSVKNIEITKENTRITRSNLNEQQQNIEIKEENHEMNMSKEETKIKKETRKELKQEKSEIKIIVERKEEINMKTNEESIKINEERIKTNEESIKINEENIKTDEESVKINEEKIKTNEENIKTDEESVKINEESMEINEERIKTNEENIKTNEKRVKTNEKKIKTNEENMKTNEENIRINEENIKTDEESKKINKENIKINEERIKTNEESIQINEKFLQTNEESMETNEESINTNENCKELKKESRETNAINMKINEECMETNEENMNISEDNLENNGKKGDESIKIEKPELLKNDNLKINSPTNEEKNTNEEQSNMDIKEESMEIDIPDKINNEATQNKIVETSLTDEEKTVNMQQKNIDLNEKITGKSEEKSLKHDENQEEKLLTEIQKNATQQQIEEIKESVEKLGENNQLNNGAKENDKIEDKKIENDDLIEIEDPDDYLLYLEEILSLIHKAFYEKYDKMKSGGVPDLKKVIPDVRSNVLKGAKLVFSGLVPTHVKLEQSKAYQVAHSLGAIVTQDLESSTTHLVAVRPGTAKVNVGRRKKSLKIVTPDWLWACAERWERVDERLFPLNNKGSKNRHPPPHCSSPEHIPNFEITETRKRTPSGRFMDTINPLMSFSSADIADMDREVEDIFNESESESENKKIPEIEVTFKPKDSDDESSSSDESLTNDHPHGWNPESISRKRSREEQEIEDESTADEFPSIKFRRGEELSSDLEFGQESNSDGSVDAPDEIDDGEWNMMGAALEREFLSNN